jgi:hypothetical protein
VTESSSEQRLSALNSVLRTSDQGLGLPPRCKVFSTAWDESGYASHYGGVDLLARHTGLRPSRFLPFEAAWVHGILEPWTYDKYPLNILCGVRHGSEKTIFVANEHQRRALVKVGYVNTHSIGSPFAYARPAWQPTRIKGSVLLMPPHTLDGNPFENTEIMEAYCIDAINRYRGSAPRLYACLHMSCIRNHLWWPTLLKHGISVVAGADHSDGHSYVRMWRLFSLFDIISTPPSNLGVGSHVFYALAAGCKVVIEGSLVAYDQSQLLKDASYQRALANQEDDVNDPEMQAERRRFEQSFAEPRMDRALGEAAIGLHCKRSPAEIRALLGWSRREQLQSGLQKYAAQKYFQTAMLAKRIRERVF